MEIEQKKSNKISNGMKKSSYVIGRPKKLMDWRRYDELYAKTQSLKRTAKELGISRPTLRKRVNEREVQSQ